MKGLPLAYSKDMQEDKEGAFDALHALSLCLAAMAGMVRDLEPDPKAMKRWAGAGYATATDLADWLVRVLDLPFRDAHHVTGRLVGARGRAQDRAGEAARSPTCRRSSRASRQRCSACSASSNRSAAARATAAPPRRMCGSRRSAGSSACARRGRNRRGRGRGDAGGSDAGRPRPRGLASGLSRYGAGRVSRFSMIRPFPLPAALLFWPASSSCRLPPAAARPARGAARSGGRRGAEAARRGQAAAAGRAPTANPTGAATAGLTEVPADRPARRRTARRRCRARTTSPTSCREHRPVAGPAAPERRAKTRRHRFRRSPSSSIRFFEPGAGAARAPLKA